MRGEGAGCGCQPMSTAVHNAHGAQINFGDLTPYSTYAYKYDGACLTANCVIGRGKGGGSVENGSFFARQESVSS